ncbi:hypothetical protein A0J61_11023 [Choanephora cucurbitarum]|uniref:OTU domain-containing protein n=1 Tax=Choanephora cucurbitarum TaxID=101091 RepID=A0A1C7MVZ5_9FUNG|nr:hypothetical protein A0J61_11023 [Choanephora cucurbitarum]
MRFEGKIEEREADAATENKNHAVCADGYDVKEAEEEVWEIEDEDDHNCTVTDAIKDVSRVIRQSDEDASTNARLSDNTLILNVATKLVELCKSLDSKQDKKNLTDSIEKVLNKTEENKTENALPPKTRTNTKGRPKNVKRNQTHYEHTLEKEKEDVKEAVSQKKKEAIEKTKTELIIRKRKPDQIAYGKSDCVFDIHDRPNKRTRGNTNPTIRSILSASINESEITGYLDPKADGNCDFRAVAFLIDRNNSYYPDGDQYLEFRRKMLQTYKNIKPLNEKHFAVFQVEKLGKVIEKGLKKKRDKAEWCYGPDCGQLVADRYGVPVCLYPSAESELPGISPPLTLLPLNLPKKKQVKARCYPYSERS